MNDKGVIQKKCNNTLKWSGLDSLLYEEYVKSVRVS